jgi:hypothetical protein
MRSLVPALETGIAIAMKMAKTANAIGVVNLIVFHRRTAATPLPASRWKTIAVAFLQH